MRRRRGGGGGRRGEGGGVRGVRGVGCECVAAGVGRTDKGASMSKLRIMPVCLLVCRGSCAGSMRAWSRCAHAASHIATPSVRPPPRAPGAKTAVGASPSPRTHGVRCGTAPTEQTRVSREGQRRRSGTAHWAAHRSGRAPAARHGSCRRRARATRATGAASSLPGVARRGSGCRYRTALYRWRATAVRRHQQGRRAAGCPAGAGQRAGAEEPAAAQGLAECAPGVGGLGWALGVASTATLGAAAAVCVCLEWCWGRDARPEPLSRAWATPPANRVCARGR